MHFVLRWPWQDGDRDHARYGANHCADQRADREAAHEGPRDIDIARADKNVIHELNVQLRELQLSEQSLKAQLTKCVTHSRFIVQFTIYVVTVILYVCSYMYIYSYV